MTSRTAISLGAFLAAVAVGLGAYGAHALDNQLIALGHEADLVKRAGWFEIGVKYHMYHAYGLLFIGILAERPDSRPLLKIASMLFVAGILLFSGSLYAMTFLGAEWSKLGAITPIGGASFIVGWICVALGARC